MTARGRYVSWSEFLAWAKTKTPIPEAEWRAGEKGSVVIGFDDGSEAELTSEYEGPLSDVTPGSGLQPPMCRIFDAREP